jgi:hypothetical protein
MKVKIMPAVFISDYLSALLVPADCGAEYWAKVIRRAKFLNGADSYWTGDIIAGNSLRSIDRVVKGCGKPKFGSKNLNRLVGCVVNLEAGKLISAAYSEYVNIYGV